MIFRILPKYGRKFIKQEFKTLIAAFKHGLEFYQTGFRIFHQGYCGWYNFANVQIIKVEDISRFKEGIKNGKK